MTPSVEAGEVLKSACVHTRINTPIAACWRHPKLFAFHESPLPGHSEHTNSSLNPFHFLRFGSFWCLFGCNHSAQLLSPSVLTSVWQCPEQAGLRAQSSSSPRTFLGLQGWIFESLSLPLLLFLPGLDGERRSRTFPASSCPCTAPGAKSIPEPATNSSTSRDPQGKGASCASTANARIWDSSNTQFPPRGTGGGLLSGPVFPGFGLKNGIFSLLQKQTQPIQPI